MLTLFNKILYFLSDRIYSSGPNIRSHKQGGWLAAIALIGSAYLGYEGSQQASGAAGAENQQWMQSQRDMFNLQDPFSAGGNRSQYVSQLNNLMKGGYAGLENDPMYQQLQNIGMQGTQRAMAAQGQGVGTNDILAINQNQTGTAMNYFNQQYGRLTNLSGANSGRTSPIQSGISPMQAGQMAMAPYQMEGQLLGSLAGLYGHKNMSDIYSSGDSGEWSMRW